MWQDNKVVNVISTNSQEGHGVVARRQKDGTQKDFSCPLSIIDITITWVVLILVIK